MYELLWFALRSKKNVHVRYLMWRTLTFTSPHEQKKKCY
jgi:hypothetical protein